MAKHPLEIAPSSPVAGTIGQNDLQRANESALSENLSRQEFSQACAALAQCAAALTALTSAIGKGSFVSTSQNPTLPAACPVSCAHAAREFMLAKARAGRSDRYLRALRVSLLSFVRTRATVPIGEVTIADLEAWIDSGNWQPRTQAGYLSDVSTLFNWCIRRGIVRENPARGVELPEDVASAPQIHTPDQVSRVLRFALEYDRNLARCLAIRYFAGLRSAEADRLREENILPGHIEVTARNSKTRKRRLVTIQPALAAWLALGGRLDFGDRGNRWRWFTSALKAKEGVDWPHNVTRHSFVSYHLAEFKNAAMTALEAGHTEQMLFAHYRELVTPGQAADFWGIRPGSG